MVQKSALTSRLGQVVLNMSLVSQWHWRRQGGASTVSNRENGKGEINEEIVRGEQDEQVEQAGHTKDGKREQLDALIGGYTGYRASLYTE
jgi:hypothetical protein